ncbi:MAG: hypothetical protein J6N76_01050 [Lachnospiraceae bacterium]|nr:hypothetical protein [Lachnospiraceae bacterium]
MKITVAEYRIITVWIPSFSEESRPEGYRSWSRGLRNRWDRLLNEENDS